MECRDRLAFWLLELLLEPVRELSAGCETDSVTVHTARGARRFNVTIVRDSGGYRWSIREVTESAGAESARLLEDQATESLSDPEFAFWEAWGALDQRAA